MPRVVVYLCARYSRHPEMQGVRDQLAALGIECRCRWIEGDHDVAELSADGVRFALEDLEDLRACNVLMAFGEGPNPKGRNRGGRHVEFGVALERGLRIVLVGPREHVFTRLTKVRQFDTFEQVLAYLCGLVDDRALLEVNPNHTGGAG